MALRRHTRALGCRSWQRQPALWDDFLNVQAAFWRRLPTNPRGSGQTLRHSESKIEPHEEALTLILSHGRGNRFAANLKKQPALLGMCFRSAGCFLCWAVGGYFSHCCARRTTSSKPKPSASEAWPLGVMVSMICGRYCASKPLACCVSMPTACAA